MGDLPGIMIFDDEIRSLKALRRILSEDFDVHIASDTKAASSILEMEWIQVILCDQRMAGTSGIEFLKQPRTRWPDIVRMIISGYTDTHDIIDGINEAGIYQYITKPWHPENLTLTLKNAVQLFLQIAVRRRHHAHIDLLYALQNFSPRDRAGNHGPLELTLERAPVRLGETEPVAVQHIVRSFDPCMMCMVH
ncbi:response regulator [Mesorhizobium mediterraneum]|uniref:response regulator n=1 Tax=Mesorhizobium mediterraneum TaxID=43617 RepID=UPI0017853DCF